ncbi:MAG: hypothetical protein AAGG72_10610 [Pseudomonadota bacterium]
MTHRRANLIIEHLGECDSIAAVNACVREYAKDHAAFLKQSDRLLRARVHHIVNMAKYMRWRITRGFGPMRGRGND